MAVSQKENNCVSLILSVILVSLSAWSFLLSVPEAANAAPVAGVAKRIILIAAAVVAGRFDVIKDGWIVAGIAIVIGEVEIAALAPIRAPAVFNDPGPISGRLVVKITAVIVVVPADNSNIVVNLVAAIVVKRCGVTVKIPTLTVNKVLIQRKPRSDRKKCEVFIILNCCIRLCVV